MDVEVSASVDLKASIDGLAAEMAKASRRAQAALDHAPSWVQVRGQGTTSAAGVTVFSCGGPSVGRVWQVRSLAVGGTGLAKGTVRIYAAATQPSSEVVQIVGARTATTFATAPLRTNLYSTGQLMLAAREQLWVVVVTATPTKVVSADGMAEDFDFAAFRGVWAL